MKKEKIHNHPTVSIIVLIMEEVRVFEKCLKSLKKYTDNYELIIVSNGSSKETIRFLESIDWIDFVLITNRKNMGFGYGCNQGIKVAKSDYICFLNSDTLVTPNWLPKLLKSFEVVKDCGIVSPTTCLGFGEHHDRSLTSKRFEMTESDILDYASKLKEGYKISSIYGFCMLTKKSILDKLGVFDYKRYGLLTGEDTDLLWRARRMGFKNVWCKGSYVHHFGRVATKQMGLNPATIRRKTSGIFEKRKREDPNLYIENDVIIENIKKIQTIDEEKY